MVALAVIGLLLVSFFFINFKLRKQGAKVERAAVMTMLIEGPKTVNEVWFSLDRTKDGRHLGICLGDIQNILDELEDDGLVERTQIGGRSAYSIKRIKFPKLKPA